MKCTKINLLNILIIIIVCAVVDTEPSSRIGTIFYPRRDRSKLQIMKDNSADYYHHKDAAKIVKSSHFELEYVLGGKITFFCMAQGLPRPEITWFKDGIELYYHRYFQVLESQLGNDTLKSKMEIDPTSQKDTGFYECQADNQYAIDTRQFRTGYVMLTY